MCCACSRRSGSYQPRVTLERAIYFTESFKTTEGQPLVLRWAKALKHIAENIPVTIFPDELIVDVCALSDRSDVRVDDVLDVDAVFTGDAQQRVPSATRFWRTT